jgi:hypothetical protein
MAAWARAAIYKQDLPLDSGHRDGIRYSWMERARSPAHTCFLRNTTSVTAVANLTGDIIVKWILNFRVRDVCDQSRFQFRLEIRLLKVW